MFDHFLLLLKEQEPLISSVVGLTTMLAAIWGVVQLMFLTGRNASRADSLVAPESVVKGSRPGRLRTLLDLGLTTYSELHFMSEELLMRMYAYPDYDDHVHDHEAMTEFLNDIMKTVTAGQDSMALKTASAMRQFLVSHISTRDEALSEYLNKVQT